MKIDKKGFHFPGYPRWDMFTDRRPGLAVLVIALLWTLVCLAAAAIYLMVVI